MSIVSVRPLVRPSKYSPWRLPLRYGGVMTHAAKTGLLKGHYENSDDYRRSTHFSGHLRSCRDFCRCFGMMKLLIIFGLFFSLPVFAANFSGNWHGTGTVDISSTGSNPAQVQIHIIQTSTKFTEKETWDFTTGGSHATARTNYDLGIAGQNVVYRGVVVGHVDATTFEMSYGDASAMSHVNAVLNPDGTMDYDYQVTDAKGQFIKNHATGLKR
jgi:hypothetical protein